MNAAAGPRYKVSYSCRNSTSGALFLRHRPVRVLRRTTSSTSPTSWTARPARLRPAPLAGPVPAPCAPTPSPAVPVAAPLPLPCSRVDTLPPWLSAGRTTSPTCTPSPGWPGKTGVGKNRCQCIFCSLECQPYDAGAGHAGKLRVRAGTSKRDGYAYYCSPATVGQR